VLDRLRTALAELSRYPLEDRIQANEAIARRLGVTSAQVLITSGIDEATDLVLHGRDEVWCVTPGFDGYRARAAVAEVTVRQLALDDNWRPPIDLPAGNPRAVCMVPQPNNPTGTIFSRPWLEDVGSRCGLLVVDRTYAAFADADAQVPKAGGRTLHYFSFSKSLGLAGLRLGALIGDEDLVAALAEIQGFQSVDRLALAAVVGALEDQAYVAATVELIRDQRTKYASALRRSEVFRRVRCTQANFVLAESAVSPASTVVDALIRHGVYTRDCAPLGLPGWIRVSVGTSADLNQLLLALREVDADLSAERANSTTVPRLAARGSALGRK
jgi:histidinol-phosphate/aromatic aminotransferase/cobyric acid decarboxylase-like protein